MTGSQHYPPTHELQTGHGDALTELILSVPAATLPALLGNPALTENPLLLVLRRQDVGSEFLTELAADQQWMRSYLVKAAMVAHPHTPKTLAMSLVKYLFWRELARLVSNAQVDPMVRRMSEVTLRDRLHEITLGERIALARMAPREVIKALRSETDEQVMRALLENPRLTEEDVILVAGSVKTPPKILVLVARSERWTSRRPVRLALVRNPRVPPRNTLPLLNGLLDREIKTLLAHRNLPSVVRKAAARLLAERQAKAQLRPE